MSTDDAGAGTSEAPAIDGENARVRAFFGDAMPAITAFRALLAEQGVARGLIGPREVERLWERHLLNSGAVARFLPEHGTVADIGSGGGFPGVVLAAMRPDLRFVLVESMERRTVWLDEVVDHLGLTNVEVVRARAEDLPASFRVEAVTARAVAPMERLAGWTLPLLKVGGVLLAMKGEQAAEELVAAKDVIDAWGGGHREVLVAETVAAVPATAVVRIVRDRDMIPTAKPRRGR